MLNIPNEAVKIEVDGASVDFFKLEKDGESTYYFDTSKMEPPHPMVNAMSGLQLIKDTKNTLVMINHKMPGGLFSKLEADVHYDAEEIDGGLVRVMFTYNADTGMESDFTQKSCGG